MLGEVVEFTTYTRRWWILGVFSFLSFQQSLLWITFSPIGPQTQLYYNCSEGAVNLLLAWGPIAYIPTVFIVCYTLGDAVGVRRSVLFGAGLVLLGGTVRLLASIDPKSNWALYVVSLSQIFNAIAGPIVMAAPPKLSAIWFSPDERTIATSISASANNLGTALGFILGTYLEQTIGIFWFLVFEGALSVLAALCIFVYFPASPPTPPSPSAMASLDEKFSLLDYWEDIKSMASAPSFLLLVLVGGWQQGIFAAWQGLFAYILKGYDSLLIGWIGTANVFAGWIGSILAGVFMDKVFNHQFKEALVFLFLAGSGFLILFTLSFPSFISPLPLVHSDEWLVILTLTVIGFLFGCAYPLFYEFAVELTYPTREASSASLFSLSNNIACLIALEAGGSIPATWINGIVSGSVIICFGLLLLVKSEYKRSRKDATADQETTSLTNSGTNIN